MGVRPRPAVSPVTPAIIGSRRPRHRIGLKATAPSLPGSRKEQRLRRSHVDGTVERSSWDAHNSFTAASHVLSWASRHPRRCSRGSRIVRDAQLWRDRPRASPPPGSGSRIRKRRPPVLADRPICAIPTTGGGDTSRRTSPQSASPPREELRRFDRGRPTSCLRTTGVLDRCDAGRPGCCYRPGGGARRAAGTIAP
jgi:hypothetical protein